ncbi:DNA cytosine methyltransferase [Amphritea sp. HPY]|uniref:DNA cytosine methyltransferase n=1 Tax=Amphritea sp. HPY TaxID=3421652 RepID=UPI003D7C84B2
MNHIELFAGCGGLTLGLEAAGFELVMANELSPMAGETFAYNFFGENLSAIADGTEEIDGQLRVKWLSSQFQLADMKSRMRENPREFKPLGDGICDFKMTEELNGSLVIGSIVELNKWLQSSPTGQDKIRDGFGRGGVDLVSGGPPCQSFSMAGLRQRSNDRNSLPWEFARFVEVVQPRVAMLENVTGILRAFTENGESFHAWFEVAKAFAEINYVPLCLHVNAKLAGVAQNRPRFIMIAVRHDVFQSLQPTFDGVENDLFTPSYTFFRDLTKGKPTPYGSLPYFDVVNASHFSLYEKSFLSPLVNYSDNLRSVRDAIDDLKKNKPVEPSQYVEQINSVFSRHIQNDDMLNHELRQNGKHVQRRFRIYQILQLLDKPIQKEVRKFLKGDIDTLSTDYAIKLLENDYLTEDDSFKFFESQQELECYLRQHQTKKQTQKALNADSPAPAALSIPDDACHYDHGELRTLSVREMARIQSFPDGFALRSKVTTGGQMRKFEVPQYTQVGNAVPPLLGRALGLVVSGLLGRLDADN